MPARTIGIWAYDGECGRAGFLDAVNERGNSDGWRRSACSFAGGGRGDIAGFFLDTLFFHGWRDIDAEWVVGFNLARQLNAWNCDVLLVIHGFRFDSLFSVNSEAEILAPRVSLLDISMTVVLNRDRSLLILSLFTV